MMMVKQPNDVSNMEQDIRLKLKKYLIGFLKFGRVTWENSSGELLEKVWPFCVCVIKDTAD
jgi:malonyl-CoA decarboxylase